MGFPVGYTELMLPTLLVRVILLLGYVRRVITVAFGFLGLSDLLDVPDIPPAHLPPPRPYYAAAVRDVLPAVPYSFLPGDADACAVCLHEFGDGAEVRRLVACRHVFHRCCLDPWVEFDQRTCPLCRTPLLPDRKGEGEENGFEEQIGVYYSDLVFVDDDDSFLPSQAQPSVWT